MKWCSGSRALFVILWAQTSGSAPASFQACPSDAFDVFIIEDLTGYSLSTNDLTLTPSSPYLFPSPVAPNFLPINLLSRDRQLPPQTLKLPFAQPAEPPIQLLLIRLLHPRHRLHNLGRRRGSYTGSRQTFGSGEPHVAVFVVVNVAFERARQHGRCRVVEVEGAEAAIPEVGGGVFVGRQEEGEGRVGGCGVDGVGGGGVVFAGVGGEGL